MSMTASHKPVAQSPTPNDLRSRIEQFWADQGNLERVYVVRYSPSWGSQVGIHDAAPASIAYGTPAAPSRRLGLSLAMGVLSDERLAVGAEGIGVNLGTAAAVTACGLELPYM